VSKSRKDEAPPLIATTLGKETSFSGILKFKDSLRLRGKFEGEIDSLGRLVIDSEAVVNARRIRASSVVVGGVVHGDIEAVDRLEMLSSAKVYGNVRTSKLRIADGVVFEGKCEMIRDPGSFDPFSGAGDVSTGNDASPKDGA
jgi:cytoskeletal protein CcmA (bactofilin family)